MSIICPPEGPLDLGFRELGGFVSNGATTTREGRQRSRSAVCLRPQSTSRTSSIEPLDLVVISVESEAAVFATHLPLTADADYDGSGRRGQRGLSYLSLVLPTVAPTALPPSCASLSFASQPSLPHYDHAGPRVRSPKRRLWGSRHRIQRRGPLPGPRGRKRRDGCADIHRAGRDCPGHELRVG